MNKFVIFFAIVATVSCAGLSDEQKEKLKNHHTECIKESGVDEELVKKARNGEFTDDPKLKEHLFCVSKKIGFQNEAGEVQEDVLRTKVNSVVKDEAKTDDLIKKCVYKKDTPQETAFETVKCYYQSTRVI